MVRTLALPLSLSPLPKFRRDYPTSVGLPLLSPQPALGGWARGHATYQNSALQTLLSPKHVGPARDVHAGRSASTWRSRTPAGLLLQKCRSVCALIFVCLPLCQACEQTSCLPGLPPTMTSMPSPLPLVLLVATDGLPRFGWIGPRVEDSGPLARSLACTTSPCRQLGGQACERALCLRGLPPTLANTRSPLPLVLLVAAGGPPGFVRIRPRVGSFGPESRSSACTAPRSWQVGRPAAGITVRPWCAAAAHRRSWQGAQRWWTLSSAHASTNYAAIQPKNGCRDLCRAWSARCHELGLKFFLLGRVPVGVSLGLDALARGVPSRPRLCRCARDHAPARVAGSAYLHPLVPPPPRTLPRTQPRRESRHISTSQSNIMGASCLLDSLVCQAKQGMTLGHIFAVGGGQRTPPGGGSA